MEKNAFETEDTCPPFPRRDAAIKNSLSIRPITSHFIASLSGSTLKLHNLFSILRISFNHIIPFHFSFCFQNGHDFKFNFHFIRLCTDGTRPALWRSRAQPKQFARGRRRQRGNVATAGWGQKKCCLPFAEPCRARERLCVLLFGKKLSARCHSHLNFGDHVILLSQRRIFRQNIRPNLLCFALFA